MDDSEKKELEAVKSLYENIPYVNNQISEKYYSPIIKSTRKNTEEFHLQDAVEVGCGGGQISIYLSRYFRTVTGIDMSERSIQVAKERSPPNAEFVVGNMFDEALISRYKRRFDHAFCCGVLHHVPSPDEGLRNIKRLIKPGGMLTIGLYSTALVDYRVRRKLTLLMAGPDPKKRMDIANRVFHNNSWDEVSLSDAYAHPLVTFWSIRKAYDMLARNGFDYSGSYPPIELSVYPKIVRDRLARREIDWMVTGKSSDYKPMSFSMVEALWVASRLPAMLFISAKLKA